MGGWTVRAAATLSTKRLLALPILFVLGTFYVLYGLNQRVLPKISSRSDEPPEVRLRQEFQRPSERTEYNMERQQQQQVSFTADTGTELPQKEATRHDLHRDGRPYLILHLGPLHTFGDELRGDLSGTLLTDALLKDNFVVADRTLQDLVADLDCHKQLNRGRRRYVTEHSRGRIDPDNTTVGHYLTAHVPCWQAALQSLESYRGRGQSVIVSTDTLAITQWAHFEDLTLSPMDWLAVEATLGELWNVELVVGYRRYGEWLPEAVRAHGKAQFAPQLLHHPAPEETQATTPEPVVPNLVQQAKKDSASVETSLGALYTQTMVDRFRYRKSGTSQIPVTVLNVHARPSVAQTFVCDVLRNAQHSCEAATSRLPPPVRATPFLGPAQLYDFYRLLVEYAAAHGVLSAPAMTMPRQYAVIGARHLHEVVRKQSLADLPVKCPKDGHVQTLLNLSLQYESNLVPAFADNRRHSDEHIGQFWTVHRNNTKQLCTVDVKRIFHDKQWRTFFRNLPKNVPAQYLPAEVTATTMRTPAPHQPAPGATVGVTRDYVPPQPRGDHTEKGKRGRGRVTTIQRRRSIG